VGGLGRLSPQAPRSLALSTGETGKQNTTRFLKEHQATTSGPLHEAATTGEHVWQYRTRPKKKPQMKVLVAMKHVVDTGVRVRVKFDGTGVELANVRCR
jgi:hypothetical protein